MTITGEPAYLILTGLMQDLPDFAPLVDRPAWHRQAACRGRSHLFFPERGESTAAAKALCASCPVSVPCYLAGEGEHGVWGGSSANDRRKAIRATAA